MNAIGHSVTVWLARLLLLATVSVWTFNASAPAPAAVALKRPGLVAQDTLSAADTGWMMMATVLVLLLARLLCGDLRVDERSEIEGLDISVHRERVGT